MVKFFCDLCGGNLELANNAQPVHVNFFLAEGKDVITFKEGQILCVPCAHSMADWAASRKK